MSGPPFSVYIVRCANGTLYTGIATDVAKRLAEHESSPRGAKFLRGKGPLQVVYSQVVGERATALRIEYRIKQLSRAQKTDLVEGRVDLPSLVPDQVVAEDSA